MAGEREEDINFEDFRKSGWDRPNNVTRRVAPNPSRGGSRGYSVDARNIMLEHPVNAPASSRSLSRWRTRIQPRRMTGNKTTQKINGRNLEMLIYFKIAFPSAIADEALACIYRNGSPFVTYFILYTPLNTSCCHYSLPYAHFILWLT